jgi:hypothetical protein
MPWPVWCSGWRACPTASQTGAPAGFAMISDNIPPPVDDLVGPYYLWKLLIDHRFQHRGCGAATLDVVVDYLRTRPHAGGALATAQGIQGSGCLWTGKSSTVETT